MKGFSTRTLAISRYRCFLVGSTIIKVSNNRVEFTFFVNYDLSKSSYVTKSKDGIIIIHINSIQFYHLLKQAIDKYKYKLETDDNLQRNFIDGWESKLKPYVKTDDQMIPPEIKYLLKKLGPSDRSDGNSMKT